ncbi:putative N6-adenine-specific DNA methylase [Cognatiyoonia koreensis]|uniref:Putative N6-adenine-specific DNA methylase n=1 Tax=Cognatiyoonia koreensis TaxID=364200 RepID=A0A1I0PUG9_9RHOB|nr:THUMP domain-containing protein [Cognatiyoonia koreensis]SEW18099.1 putative N6-adenine-specific DNA methylase [Cognatiyoonia koreensis]
MKPLNIFLATAPGFEDMLEAEARDLGLTGASAVAGGVTFAGHWPAIWRANYYLRGATRVLVQIGKFRVFHLDELERLAMEFPWDTTFKPDSEIGLDFTTKSSKVNNISAISQRLAKALRATVGVSVDEKAPVTLRVRIDNNVCMLSVDTSGDPLHIRGHKQFVGKAPMRESLAALMLRKCGYDGSELVVDPMCGSGTFPIEAAEIARNLAPGRSRDFAFQHLATFQPDRFAAIKEDRPARDTDLHFYGSDRDAGGVKGAGENAARAGVDDIITFAHHAISDLQRPAGKPGLVMVNPPYGGRIGNKKQLFALYGALGKTLRGGFSGWRVGLVTSESGLAKVTELPWQKNRLTFPHGGMRVTLSQTGPLP